MGIIKDARNEVQGRNRELRKLVEQASWASRVAFSKYLALAEKLELQGDNPALRSAVLDAIKSLQFQSDLSYPLAFEHAQDLLNTTSRWRALDLSKIHPLPVGPAYARYVWMLGVGGVAELNGGPSLEDFLLGIASWHAESLIRLLAHPAESSLLSIEPSARHSRVENGGTRFRWICALVAEGIDSWATERGGLEGELFGSGKTIALATAIADALPLPSRDVLKGLHPKVVNALTAPHISRAKLNELSEGNGPEVRPLVKFGDEIHIGNASALVLGLEVPLIAAIKELLGSEAQGDAFEYVCHFIAVRLLPTDVRAFRDSFVSDQLNSTEGDEVDLHLSSPSFQVIVEAKSHLPAKNAVDAANTFEELLKANKQVKRRVDRLKAGKWIRRNRLENQSQVSGLVVSLHDYTAQVWRPDSMVEAEEKAFVVLPIHAFAMALGAVRSASDLREFLSVRATIGQLGMSGGDELEMLLGWISGWTADSLRADIHAADPEGNATIRVRPYSMSTDNQLTADWVDFNAWRKYLVRASNRVHDK